jgi:hypothetical protein
MHDLYERAVTWVQKRGGQDNGDKEVGLAGLPNLPNS